MKQYDTESTDQVLLIFKAAWLKSIEDYKKRKINSEHCLQASIYRHLVNEFPETYTVYAEAVVKLSEATKLSDEKTVAKIDLLICRNHDVVAAIEIKYIPRDKPKIKCVRKDLTSLSCISKRRDLGERCFIEIPRFRNEDSDVLALNVLSQRKLIFAAFCAEESTSMQPAAFWKAHRPQTGYWERHESYPKNLCVAIAYANKNGEARTNFFAPGFARISEKFDL